MKNILLILIAILLLIDVSMKVSHKKDLRDFNVNMKLEFISAQDKVDYEYLLDVPLVEDYPFTGGYAMKGNKWLKITYKIEKKRK